MNINRVIEKLGIRELSDMQQQMYDAVAYSRSDIQLLSPTGSGKTLAYLLPLAEQVDVTRDEVQVLVIVPGRELALQTDRVLKDMGTGVRSVACYGGRPTMDEHRTLKTVRPQMVFGTPGRLNDHIDKGNISIYNIRCVVLDEFDKCLEMGFMDEMSRLLGKMPAGCRRILLSATDGEVNIGGAWQRLDFLPDEDEATANERVTMLSVRSPQKDKLQTLRTLLCEQGNAQSIVFLNFRDAVERVGSYLRQEGFGVSVFHGGLDQKQREAALYRFSNGSSNVLVCTDLASRGLDIPDVANVIHYHLPQSEQELVHRVGRTARWDKWGTTFFIVGPEESIDHLSLPVEEYDIQAEHAENNAVPVPQMATVYIGKGKKDKISKGDIMGFLCKVGELDRSEIGRIDIAERYAYAAVKREKMQQVVRKTSGEKIKGIRTIVEPVK